MQQLLVASRSRDQSKMLGTVSVHDLQIQIYITFKVIQLFS